jgi:hypothetical protein
MLKMFLKQTASHLTQTSIKLSETSIVLSVYRRLEKWTLQDETVSYILLAFGGIC